VAEREGGFGGVEWHFIVTDHVERPEFHHTGYFDAVFYDSFLVDLDFAVAVADLQNFIFRHAHLQFVGQAAFGGIADQKALQSLLLHFWNAFSVRMVNVLQK